MRNDHFAGVDKMIVIPAWRPGSDEQPRGDEVNRYEGQIEKSR